MELGHLTDDELIAADGVVLFDDERKWHTTVMPADGSAATYLRIAVDSTKIAEVQRLIKRIKRLRESRREHTP